jgi:hypothetical protein
VPVCAPQRFGLQAKLRSLIFYRVMLLHRYFGSHALETLKEAKLKTTRITSFNDPFEFLFVTTGKLTAPMARKYVLSRLKEPDFLQIVAHNFPGFSTAKNPKKFLEKNTPLIIANFVKNSDDIMQLPFKMREEMADRSTRVVCFSNSAINPLDEILLWSHYANKHEGVRIGFEFPKNIKFPFKIYKVEYTEKRLVIDVSQGMLDQTLGQAVVESAKMKSLAWKYEDEYRLITYPDVCEHRTMPDSKKECFLTFEREWVKTIDFGVRYPEKEIELILNLLKTDYPKIVRRKAVFHKTEYALEYKEI